MASKTSSAFTIVEILVVTVIILIIAGLSYPVWVHSKLSARETETRSNLHQAWLALELYRQDNDSSATSGSRVDLGLPFVDDFLLVLLPKNGIKWWMSPNRIAYGPIYYPLDKTDNITNDKTGSFTARLNEWLDYSSTAQQGAVIIGDFHHTIGCEQYPNSTCIFTGNGINLAGSLTFQKRSGYIDSPHWWETKQ